LVNPHGQDLVQPPEPVLLVLPTLRHSRQSMPDSAVRCIAAGEPLAQREHQSLALSDREVGKLSGR